MPAAELEAMSPPERRALFEASIVTNLDEAPQAWSSGRERESSGASQNRNLSSGERRTSRGALDA